MDFKQKPIKKFEILGLHGDRNITVDFDSPVKILVSENGAGKTTVLNTLFNILSRKWFRLRQIEFQAINITFSKGKEIEILREDIFNAIGGFWDHPLLRELANNGVDPDSIRRIVDFSMHGSYSAFTRYIDQNLDVAIDISPRILYEELRALRRYPQKSLLDEAIISKKISNVEKVEKLNSQLGQSFPYELLYFPTYRRVEEDLRNLGYVEKDINRDEQLIQFGMHDVQKRFEQITSKIRESSVEWYSIISGQMLKQLASGIQQDSIDYRNIQNRETLKIVLDRIGENISNNDKDHILALIQTGDIRQERFAALAYFLSSLIKVYDQQKESDNAIKNFARVVNQYFLDKEIRYNESKVSIEIDNKRTGKEVLLDRLSSGEKQVISIFSRMYLENTKQYAVLFDEPELSLSMEWQKNLLKDVVESSNCVFLLAATHSPFIYENELDSFASVLNVCFLEN